MLLPEHLVVAEIDIRRDARLEQWSRKVTESAEPLRTRTRPRALDIAEMIDGAILDFG